MRWVVRGLIIFIGVKIERRGELFRIRFVVYFTFFGKVLVEDKDGGKFKVLV